MTQDNDLELKQCFSVLQEEFILQLPQQISSIETLWQAEADDKILKVYDKLKLLHQAVDTLKFLKLKQVIAPMLVELKALIEAGGELQHDQQLYFSQSLDHIHQVSATINTKLPLLENQKFSKQEISNQIYIFHRDLNIIKPYQQENLDAKYQIQGFQDLLDLYNCDVFKSTK